MFLGAPCAQAQGQAAYLLVLNHNAIDYGPAPHLLPADAVDSDVAGVGVRDGLHYFQSHIGSQVVLTSGQSGNDGWFALRSVPNGWATDEVDGLKNFGLAGPGLGSPDDNGDRESLLANVSNVVPVRANGVALLVGQNVCAVVYSGDITLSGDPPTASLQGPTLGRVAFSVVSLVPTDDADHPQVQVQIADWSQTCGSLQPFANAP
jgi:hypothetical protein